MWIRDLTVALNELYTIYGEYVTVDKIENNLIYVSDFTVWVIDSNGHIERSLK